MSVDNEIMTKMASSISFLTLAYEWQETALSVEYIWVVYF